MQIRKDGELTFKPYTINILVTDQRDEDVLVGLGKSNVSLPDLLEKSRHVKQSATYSFCQQLNDIYGNR
jgi:hypothetical protein